MERTFLTVAETTLVLGTSKSAVNRLLRDGTLPTLPRYGYTVRVAAGTLRELAEPARVVILEELLSGRFVLARTHPQGPRRDDPPGDWLAARCRPGEDCLPLDDLARDHRRWCRDTGRRPARPRLLSQRLSLAGYTVETIASRHAWCHGILLGDFDRCERETLTRRETAACLDERPQADTRAFSADDLHTRLDPSRLALLDCLLTGTLAVPMQPPSDGVREFLDECCEAGGEEVSQALFDAYRSWCSQRPLVRPLPRNAFGMRLTDLGYQRRRATREPRTRWAGLHLHP